MSYMEKFLPKAAQPYAVEIVGGGAGFAAYKLLNLRPYRRWIGLRRMMPAIGMAAGSFATEGALVPNLVGLGLAAVLNGYPPRFVRSLHKKYAYSPVIVATAAYAIGKTAAKKVL